jgi:hypothetical protein
VSVAAGALGTWTPLAKQASRPVDTCELLTDASVMCHEIGTAHWHLLTPDTQGSYVNGTWDSRAISDMPHVTVNGCANCPYAPVYFASAVLADGRVVVAGGEYFVTPSGSELLVWSNLGFLYDPAADTWSGPFTGGFPSGSVGDSMGVVLRDGRFLLQDTATTNLESLDPATLSFTILNPTGNKDVNDEESLHVLPDGRLLTVAHVTPSSYEFYDPVANRWGDAGTTPVNLADTDSTGLDGGARQPTEEVGPAVLRPDGKLVYFTANLSGHNALYDTTSGTWTTAPSGNFPTGYVVQDGPASLLPNGNVLVMASLGYSAPSHFFEFSLAANALQATTDASGVATIPSLAGRLVLLPTGEVLFTGNGLPSQTYSNGQPPQDAWRPVITSAPSQVTPGNTYSVSGQLFNGFSQGAFYGDDAQSSTNYPLVRITNVATGHVRYAKTHDHSRMGVEAVGDTELISTQFDVPSDLEPGPSSLAVVANGIASQPVTLNGSVVVSAVPAAGKACEVAFSLALMLVGTLSSSGGRRGGVPPLSRHREFPAGPYAACPRRQRGQSRASPRGASA